MSPGAKRYPSTDVCERYRISRRTLARWMLDERLAFPKPIMTVNGRYYFGEAELATWEKGRSLGCD